MPLKSFDVQASRGGPPAVIARHSSPRERTGGGGEAHRHYTGGARQFAVAAPPATFFFPFLSVSRSFLRDPAHSADKTLRDSWPRSLWDQRCNWDSEPSSLCPPPTPLSPSALVRSPIRNFTTMSFQNSSCSAVEVFATTAEDGFNFSSSSAILLFIEGRRW